MHSYKKKLLPAFVFSLLILFLLPVLVKRVNKNLADNIKIEVYFPNTITNLIESEERNITTGENKNVLEQAIHILYDGPKSKNLSSFQVSDLKLLDIDLDENKTAEINFSSEYNNLSLRDELFFRGSLVWTLTSLDFVDNLKIFIDGKELKKFDGTAMNLLNRTNVVINPEISDEKINLQVVKLYFRENNKLVSEDRMININPSQLIEKYILEQIISGPISSNLSATVPQDTKIRDIKTDENICYVSLSGEFASKNNDSESWFFALYSIVNSLTELENINKVQFLIESEKTNQPEWIFDLNKPFERNEKIIQRDEK